MTNVCQIWKIVIVLTAILRPTSVQFMPMMPPPMPPPMPMPMPMAPPPPMFMPPPMIMGAFAFRIPNKGNEEKNRKTTTTTTTTTTEANIAIVMPMPVPLPVQFGLPAPPVPLFCQAKPRPPNCPPCPPCVCTPSCTPAFFSFCSPCHQKCRCSNGQAPLPMPPQPPIPVPGPAYPIPFPGPPMPVIVVPYPPARPKYSSEGESTKESSCDDETDVSYCSDESDARRIRQRYIGRSRKKNRKRLLRIHRRNMPSSDSDNDNYVKPVLSYVSSNGDVMIKKSISDYDADRLMGQGQKVRVVNEQDKEIVVMSDGGYDRDLTRKHNVMSLRRGGQKATLGTGKKELVFKPPQNKKISNLSVTFNVD